MTALLRIMQSLPLVVALALIAGIVYFVVSYTKSPNRAKEVLINLFLVIGTGLCVIFGLVCLYCLFEGNQGMLEFFAMFLAISVLTLAITLICRAVFRKHHPHYQFKRIAARFTKEGKKEKTGTYDEWE